MGEKGAADAFLNRGKGKWGHTLYMVEPHVCVCVCVCTVCVCTHGASDDLRNTIKILISELKLVLWFDLNVKHFCDLKFLDYLYSELVLFLCYIVN